MLQGWMQADVLMESKLRQQKMKELAKFWWSALDSGEHNWYSKAALSATRSTITRGRIDARIISYTTTHRACPSDTEIELKTFEE
jgi:hypothetical protein